MDILIDELSFAQRLKKMKREFVEHYSKYWKWWVLAGVVIAVIHNFAWVNLNLISKSLPNTFFITCKVCTPSKGDYVTYSWHGGAQYKKGLMFTKIIRGVEGDVVAWNGRDVYINGDYIATAKTHSKNGVPLELGPSGVIPKGKIFVYATSPDSLDSRYGVSGWIDEKSIVGKSYGYF